MSIFRKGFDFVKGIFDHDDSEQELQKSQTANSTPSGFFTQKDLNQDFVFKVGEGLKEPKAKVAKATVTKQPVPKPSPISSALGSIDSFEKKQQEFFQPSPDGTRARDVFREFQQLFAPTEEDVVKTKVTIGGKEQEVETTKFGEFVSRDQFGNIRAFDPLASAGSLKRVGSKGVEQITKGAKKLSGKATNFLKNIADSSDLDDLFSFTKKIFPKREESEIIRIADDLKNIKTPDKVQSYLKQIDNIEPSVVQIVDNKTGDVTYKTIQKGQLDQFNKLIDDTTSGIAGHEIDGKIYHVTAKTPGKMDRVGATFDGMANLDEIPVKADGNIPDRIFNINLDKMKLKPEQKIRLDVRTEKIKPELEAWRGKPMSQKEVLKASQESDVLQRAVTRDETLQRAASLTKSRDEIVRLDNVIAKTTDPKTKQALIEEQIELMKLVSAEASDAGRKLNAFKITAEGEDAVMRRVLDRIGKTVDDTEGLAKKASEVDWNNADEVSKFYREFVKPTTKEIFDEYRYNNMLSNPRTQMRNIMSNTISSTIVRPTTKLVEAGIDTFASLLTGKDRQVFFKEVPEYYKGFAGAIPEAFDEFAAVWKGQKFNSNQDLADIGGGAMRTFLKDKLKVPEKVADKVGAAFNIPTKTLESVDRMLMKMVSEGEKASLLKRGMSEVDATKAANRVSTESLFRAAIDPKNKSGHGKLLSVIDNATTGIDTLREKIPGLSWFVPFVKTPMNFAKQWIEYSPAGLFTLPGNMRKKEQLAKMVVGSSISAAGAMMAWEGRTTWGVPTDAKEKELFFASGKKPYSVKIGNNWVPMMYLGPWAYAVALPAALKYNHEDSKTALTDTQMQKISKDVGSIAEFLSQQTFLEGLGNFLDVAKGDEDANIEKSLAFTAGQTVPWQGLVRYISTIIDPVFRKSDSFLEAVQRDLPFLSQKLEPYRLPTGEESTRNTASYLAPYDISQEKKEFADLMDIRTEQLQINNLLNQNDKKIKKQAVKLAGELSDAKTKGEAKAVLKKFASDETMANAVLTVIKKQALYAEASLEPLRILKDQPKAIAQIIYGRALMARTKTEFKKNVMEYIEDLQEAGIYTDSVNEWLIKVATEEITEEGIVRELEGQKTKTEDLETELDQEETPETLF